MLFASWGACWRRIVVVDLIGISRKLWLASVKIAKHEMTYNSMLDSKHENARYCFELHAAYL